MLGFPDTREKRPIGFKVRTCQYKISFSIGISSCCMIMRSAADLAVNDMIRVSGTYIRSELSGAEDSHRI